MIVLYIVFFLLVAIDIFCALVFVSDWEKNRSWGYLIFDSILIGWLTFKLRRGNPFRKGSYV